MDVKVMDKEEAFEFLKSTDKPISYKKGIRIITYFHELMHRIASSLLR